MPGDIARAKRVFRAAVATLAAMSLGDSVREARADNDPALVAKRLDNGLRVVFAQDHRTPFVSVNVRYDVGSRDERDDQHGLAHLVEHLAFRATQHIPDGGLVKHLESVGAIRINGLTHIDSTAFFEFVPSNALERVLWLESERMGYLADAVTAEALRSEREIVDNERAQKHDYGLATAFMPSLFPEGHPYHAVRAESSHDMRRLKVDEVRAFIRQFYVPNNAVLVVVGDMLPSRALPLVQRWFGTLPAGGYVSRDNRTPLPPIPYSRSVRLDVSGGVAFPTVVMAWRTAALFEPGDAELDVLATLLCSHLRSETAKSTATIRRFQCAQQSFELGSVFTVQAVLGPSGRVEDMTGLVDDALEKLSRISLPPEVVSLANVNLRSERLFSIEAMDARGSMIAEYVRKTGTPDFFARDLARYDQVDPEVLRSVVQGSLRFQGRVVLFAQPDGSVLNASQNGDAP